MKYMKKIFSIVCALNLLCMGFMPADAREVPDESRMGTITVKMAYDGRAVTGGTLTAYRVGQIQEIDGNYSFTKTDAMDSFTGSYDDIDSAELAEDLADFVRKNNLNAYAVADNQNGEVVFEKIESGLYLIVQTEASEGYEPLKAFLISVPMNENGQYVYEVNAEGKLQLQQTSNPTTPEKPVTPTDSKLPQTGQLNWPIPVFAVLGMCLFLVGWALRFGRKSCYEK